MVIVGFAEVKELSFSLSAIVIVGFVTDGVVESCSLVSSFWSPIKFLLECNRTVVC